MAFPWVDVSEFSFLGLNVLWSFLVLIRAVEQNLPSLDELFASDIPVRRDPAGVSRRKALALLERIRPVLERVLNLRHDPGSPLLGILTREARRSLWDGQLHLPEDIRGPASDLLDSCVRAARFFESDRKAYGDCLARIRDDYARLVSRVRETYYVTSEQR